MTRTTLLLALLLCLASLISLVVAEPPPNCRVPENKKNTSSSQCKALQKKAKSSFCKGNQIVSIGFVAVCPRPCTSRAYLKCSQKIKTDEKLDEFDCYASDRKDVAKLVKQLIKQECKKLAPYFRDGGCKNSDGEGNHGCSELHCPTQCVKLGVCRWVLPGGAVLDRAEVRGGGYTNPTTFYAGSCQPYRV